VGTTVLIKQLLPAAVAVTLIGCAEKADRAEGDDSAQLAEHEQVIRRTNEQWLRLIKDGNAKAVAQLYAPDGAIMPPGAPKAQGPSDVEKVWGGLMKMPGFALTFRADDITIAAAGDMALDRGTYRLTTSGPNGPTQDIGKYVVVWRNIDGTWKIAADIFNSDGPQAAGQTQSGGKA
jgi:ketosteroid isomerase-like protein